MEICLAFKRNAVFQKSKKSIIKISNISKSIYVFTVMSKKKQPSFDEAV